MKTSRFTLWILTALIVLGIESAAFAYRPYGYSWPNSKTTFYSKGTTNDLWNNAFIEALAKWNDLSNFVYYHLDAFSDPCSNYSAEQNGWSFENTDCGVSFGSATLAITSLYYTGNDIVEADIIFNSNESWDVFSDKLSGVFDFRRVAVHELGHALGLDHEDAYPSIVNSYYSDTIETPQTDDINGIRAIYGGLGNTWANLEAFVTRFYQECLGRSPDPGGLNGWTNYLLSGTKTGADVAYGFAFSPEYLGMNTTDQEFLYDLYKAFFNRQPDSGGYARWLNELSCNTPIVGQKAARKNILNAFLGAPEFKTLCSNYGITRGSVTYVRPTCSKTSSVSKKRLSAKQSSSLLGTYTLADFLIVHNDGARVGSGDFAYLSGTTEINGLNIHQQITLNGTTGTVPSQNYSITPATGTYDGIIHTTTGSGVSYDIYYYTDENQLVMVTDATKLGVPGTVYEYWEKTSDTFSTSSSEPFSSIDNEFSPNNYNLGVIVGEIIK